MLDEHVVTLAVEGGVYAHATGRGQTLDLTHLWAVPGLVDAHAHLIAASTVEMLATSGERSDMRTMRRYARDQLAGGVLLMLDKGAKNNTTLAMLDIPEPDRPELQMAGKALAPKGGYYPEFPVAVSGDDLEREVEIACSTTAAQWIKVVGDWPRKGRGAVPNYTEEELAAAVAVAHGHGRRVAVHTMAPEAPSFAVRAGVDSIEHGLFLTISDIEALGARRGMWVPTLVAMEGVRDQLGAESSGRRLLTRGLENVASLLTSAVDAGVHVLGGTDIVLPHGAVALEAPKLVEYGLSPKQATWAVTGAGYVALGISNLESGCAADVTLFSAHPHLDVNELQTPVGILRRGTWLVAPPLLHAT